MTMKKMKEIWKHLKDNSKKYDDYFKENIEHWIWRFLLAGLFIGWLVFFIPKIISIF